MRWPNTIRTKRLLLRPWREGDADALFRYASDPAVGPAAGWKPHESIEESRRVLRDVLMVPEVYAIELIERPDEAVGAIGLTSPSPRLDVPKGQAELGYWIGRPFWGKGYMTEAVRAILRHAFLDLGLSAVWASSNADNDRSRRVQEGVGMALRRHADRTDDSGMTRELDVRQLTREEWERSLTADPTDGTTIGRQQVELSHILATIPLVARIRSGGQTGADRGGLDAARDAGVPICGWCPPGGLAEDLTEPPGVLALYPELVEGHASGYVERTAWNVRDSHATLIVAPDGLEPRSGTEMTAIFAEQMERPYLVIEGWSVKEGVARALTWLSGLGSRGLTLNVAGPRESKLPGVYDTTRAIVSGVLADASRKPQPSEGSHELQN